MKPAATNYDVIIIGAGMSGLAAGIRLAHFNRRVCILEQHALPGGLNSYYRRGGRAYDVGLHAMTNFVQPGGSKHAPLHRLLRQLRLPYEALELREQGYSEVRFPGATLRFSNDPEELAANVAGLFPAEIDGFRKLVGAILGHDAYALDAPAASARERLAEHIRAPLLREMLLCPLMYYGNAAENDMDFTQFCIMFRSIFLEGFCRPRAGVRTLLDLLVGRYRECGGELCHNCGVRKILVRDGVCQGVVLADGQTLAAGQVLSCAGFPETMRLCEPAPARNLLPPVGQLAFMESIFVLDTPPAALGFHPSIVFFNHAEEFAYKRPAEAVSLASGVLCAPDNFPGAANGAGPGMLRLTHMADYAAWLDLPEVAYRAAKDAELEMQQAALAAFVPGVSRHILATDAFTPATIKRFTGHLNGTVYGSPRKQRDGATPYAKLALLGTDQGFLGIVGALLSGASMANYHCLK